MMVIVASAWDESACALADAWSAYEVRLLTPLDLSRPGWYCPFGSSDAGTAVLGGERVPVGEVRAVLTRLGWVTEHEIPHVTAGDRAYVASEMHAFLFAWLSRVSCPILNRPTAYCLAGPSWRNEKWLHVAAGLGIPIRAVRRAARAGLSTTVDRIVDDSVAVTVAGDYWAGESRLVESTRTVAAAAGVDMLTAYYSASGTPELLGVSLWPDVTNAAVQMALLDWFRDRTVLQ